MLNWLSAVVFLLFLLIPISTSTLSTTYTFTLIETNLNNFDEKDNLTIQVDASLVLPSNLAYVHVYVTAISRFKFAIYINGANCGILNNTCIYLLQPKQRLNIQIYKLDMKSNLITFVYPDDHSDFQLFIFGCRETLATDECQQASQDTVDTRGTSYQDNLCFCRSDILTCSASTKMDNCVSGQPFWNYHPNTSIGTTQTSSETTIPTETTTVTTHTPSSTIRSTSTVTSDRTTPVTSTTVTSTTRTTQPPSTTASTVTSTTRTTPTPSTTASTAETTASSTKASTTTTEPATTTTTIATTTLVIPTSTTTIATTLPSTTTIPITTTTMSTTTETTTTTTVPTTTTTTDQTTETTSTIPTTSSSLPSTTTTPLFDGFPSLKNLSDSGVGINNISTVLNDTLTYSKMGSDLNATQVMEISTILINCANVPGLTAENSMGILQNLDNILNVNSATMYGSGNSAEGVLQALPMMVHNTEEERVEYLNGYNLGFSSRKIDCAKLEKDDGILDLGDRFELINSTDSLGSSNSIIIPLTELCSSQELTHVFFTIYRETCLFVGPQMYKIYDGSNRPISQSGNDKQYYNRMKRDVPETTTPLPDQSPIPNACARQKSLPPSPVMSATLLNNGVTLSTTVTQSTMAMLRFDVSKFARPLHGEMKVTWWDTSRKEWSDDRQCQIISNKDGIIDAQCTHLTDFAIIVDAAINDPNVCDNALMDLGYIVNSLSIISLTFLTFFSICAYIKTLSQSRFYGYFRGHNLARRDLLALAYHFDLLLFYVFFTVFSNQEVSGDFCTAMAAVMYSLLLSSLFLTIFQGLRNILTFVPPRIYRYLDIFLSSPSILSICVAIPFTFSILMLVFTTFFNRDDCFCWVRPDYIVAAIIIPVSVLLLSSLICTCFIVYKVFFGMKRKFSQGGNHHYDPNFVTKIISIIIMQISLGMPWILQFGTLYSPYTTLWHYLFTIVLGSQGTILLIIFIYKRYRARQADSLTKSRTESIRRRNTNNNNNSNNIRRESTINGDDEVSLGSSTDTFYEY